MISKKRGGINPQGIRKPRDCIETCTSLAGLKLGDGVHTQIGFGGYSTRSLPEFTKELEKRHITRLIDVRSRPSSRNPSFNRKAIERWTEKLGIYYRFEGEALGGDPDEGRELSVIANAISRIAQASGSENVAIMCAEGDPAKCHRTWDVAVHLMISHGVEPISILRDGTEESATQSLKRVSKRNLPAHASQYLSAQRALF